MWYLLSHKCAPNYTYKSTCSYFPSVTDSIHGNIRSPRRLFYLTDVADCRGQYQMSYERPQLIAGIPDANRGHQFSDIMPGDIPLVFSFFGNCQVLDPPPLSSGCRDRVFRPILKPSPAPHMCISHQLWISRLATARTPRYRSR